MSDDWENECSICKGPINTATDNYVSFGYQEFRRWGLLGNVCAECVIDVFEAFDLVMADLKTLLAEAEEAAPKQKDLASEERS